MHTQLNDDFLQHVEFLPDGTATNDLQIWVNGWAEFLQQQITSGKIDVNTIEGFDPDTGILSTAGIKKLYENNRLLH